MTHSAPTQESINTLKFGERARQLCTKPRMNTDVVMDERKLRAALARAEARIMALTEALEDQVSGLKVDSSLSGLSMFAH